MSGDEYDAPAPVPEPAGPLRLEVGSGNNPCPGFQHADVDARMPDLQYVCELDAIPVPPCTFAEVRSVHSIEHVSMGRARRALLEWHRILVPGGRVYIDTPNIGRNAMLYANGGWLSDFATLTTEQRAFCSHDGKPSRGLWLNFKVFSDDDAVTAWNLHRWNADPELLVDLLHEAGFKDFRVIATEPSLIVEAFK